MIPTRFAYLITSYSLRLQGNLEPTLGQLIDGKLTRGFEGLHSAKTRFVFPIEFSKICDSREVAPEEWEALYEIMNRMDAFNWKDSYYGGKMGGSSHHYSITFASKEMELLVYASEFRCPPGFKPFALAVQSIFQGKPVEDLLRLALAAPLYKRLIEEAHALVKVEEGSEYVGDSAVILSCFADEALTGKKIYQSTRSIEEFRESLYPDHLAEIEALLLELRFLHSPILLPA
jgi:hypothetical protein